MAPCYGAGPLRRSEGVWKICPARSEAEDQQVQIFSPNGTAAVFRFLFGGKKEQSPLPAASAGKVRNLNLAAKVAGPPQKLSPRRQPSFSLTAVRSAFTLKQKPAAAPHRKRGHCHGTAF